MEITVMKHHGSYLKPHYYDQLIEYFYTRAKECLTIVKQGTKSKKPKKHYMYYRMMYHITDIVWHTGRRCSEIIGQKPYIRLTGIRPCDCDFHSYTIKFRIAKKRSILKRKVVEQNMKNRKRDLPPDEVDRLMKLEHIKKESEARFFYVYEIPVPHETMNRLKKFIDEFAVEPNQPIFRYYTTTSAPICRGTVDRLIKEAAEKLGITFSGTRPHYNDFSKKKVTQPMKLSIHKLRHGFSKDFLKTHQDNPEALAMLQKLLKHENINTTATYLTSDVEGIRNFIDPGFTPPSEIIDDSNSKLLNNKTNMED